MRIVALGNENDSKMTIPERSEGMVQNIGENIGDGKILVLTGNAHIEDMWNLLAYKTLRLMFMGGDETPLHPLDAVYMKNPVLFEKAARQTGMGDSVLLLKPDKTFPDYANGGYPDLLVILPKLEEMPAFFKQKGK